jgi:hypothetical protein
VHGLNLFEATWVRGTDTTRVERRVAQFMVNRDAFTLDQDFVVSIDANPEGSDVHLENVLMAWHGDRALEFDGWMVRDLANHRYAFPDGVVLAPGQRLRIFTGGDPAQDVTAPAATEKVLHMGRRAAIWNNTGDLLELVDARGVIVWSEGYGDFFRGGA